MSIRRVFSTILSIAVLSAGALASPQLSDQAARRQAENIIRAELHLRPDQFLGIQRDEKLEQALALAAGKRAEPAFVYRVSQAGDEFQEDGVVHHISTGADLAYIIAVDSAGASSYRIHGFPDSVAEFGKLMTRVGMKVVSSKQAESVAEFYRAVNPENLSLAPIASLIELKQAAERQCHSGVKSFDAGQKAFAGWWSRARPAYATVEFQERSVPQGIGYQVEWTVLSSSSRENCGGAPLRARLEVRSDGHVSKVTISPIRENPGS